jgi:hypothetical protein
LWRKTESGSGKAYVLFVANKVIMGLPPNTAVIPLISTMLDVLSLRIRGIGNGLNTGQSWAEI